MNVATEFSNRRFCVEKSLGRERSKCKDYFRPNQLQLPNEVRSARRDLFRCRVSVAGRTVFHNVCDENLVPREVDGGKDLGQELTCGSDERQTLLVLVGTRSFANAHEIRIRIS